MKEYFIGVDIGTSSTRAVLFNSEGRLVFVGSEEYPMDADAEGKAELDADTVFEATVKALKKCLDFSGPAGARVAGMGLSCQMHSLMAVYGDGRPLTPLMTWADTRAGKEAASIAENFPVAELYQRTGCRVQHPMYPLSKLLWLKNNRPDVFKKARRFITIKEYVLYRLYGAYLADYTLASSQGFYNIHSQDWDEPILKDILGIGRNRLGEVVECTHILRKMKPEYADFFGLDKDTPVVIGSGDGIMANLGCGVYDSTSLSSTIGTSGAIRTAAGAPMLDPEQRTWCYSFTKDMWVAGGAINNGGIVLRWLRDTLGNCLKEEAARYGGNVYKLFDRLASETKAGSEGLIFLPYLTGERSPDWNAKVRGMMYGLNLTHGIRHIVRAAMEGVIYRMYSVYEVMESLGLKAAQIRANGGYAKSDVWLQIQADVFNKDILVPDVTEASALGAAYLCMVALGAVSDIKKLLPGMEPKRVIKPSAENHRVYRDVYIEAGKIYDALCPKE